MWRGEVWWADLPSPTASEPGHRRPLLIVQSDAFNASGIRTVVGVVLTTNLRLAAAPGNLKVTAAETGLPQDSVINVSQLVTADRAFLAERVGQVSGRVMSEVDDGLRTVLAL